MIKTFFAATICTFAAGLASADEMKTCDQPTFDMVMAEVDKAADGEAKEMAMKELEMAKTAMTDNMADECSKHLTTAAEQAMKQ